MKIFLSVPKTVSDETRLKLLYKLENEGYTVVCPIFDGSWWSEEKMHDRGIQNCNLNIFAETLRDISNCEAIYFEKSWKDDPICTMEHSAAEYYNMKIMFEDIE